MRGQRGQVAAEYVGVLLVVSVIIAALASTDLGRELSLQAKAQICRVAETPCEKSAGRSERSKRSRAAAPLARAALRDPKGNDSDGDGVSDARERAQHTDPGSPDTDHDGLGDASDPAPRDADFDNDGLRDGEDPVPGHQDFDRDGLTDGQEIALGTNPRSGDTDGDGRLDRAEFDAGSDPTKRVLPLTEENAFKPWERVGMTEKQWFELSKKILKEVNPKGWRKWFDGERYWGVNLDEKGHLRLLDVNHMAAVNPRAILELLGAASKLPSVAAVAARAAGAMPIAVGAALMARSVIPTVARIKTPPPPAVGITYGPVDKLGRATGAAATITKNMINAGTRASARIKPPGFADGAIHDRGHLIGKLLGGLGTDARNLTTIFKNANTPVMRGFERQIANAVRGGQVVRYQVTPIYRGSDPIPRGITMKAYGSGSTPLNLHVTVLNIPKP